LEATLARDVTKLMLIARPERIPSIRERVRVFEESRRAGVFVTDPHIVQVAAHGVDKGAALARHAARLGVDRSRVLAIGDASNDVEMLRWAGLGVAMANAEALARDAADETIERTNDQAGAAFALRRFGVL
jgi:HAD superfamily hydrolase (TIGR01484 family)